MWRRPYPAACKVSDCDSAVMGEWTGGYPHAEAHRIETTTHFLQEDDPERALEMLEYFLRRNP